MLDPVCGATATCNALMAAPTTSAHSSAKMMVTSRSMASSAVIQADRRFHYSRTLLSVREWTQNADIQARPEPRLGFPCAPSTANLVFSDVYVNRGCLPSSSICSFPRNFRTKFFRDHIKMQTFTNIFNHLRSLQSSALLTTF